jgi:tetratricopeptide (TPR) repeat protein
MGRITGALYHERTAITGQAGSLHQFDTPAPTAPARECPMQHITALVIAIALVVAACARSERATTPDDRVATEPAPAPVRAAPDEHAGHEVPVDATAELGAVDFATSCAPAVRDGFNRALALLHHMMYTQAQEQFLAVAEADPECAMAHWGVAMTVFHPLWPDTPAAEQMARGERALERARELEPKTARERAYIDAASAYYRQWQDVGEGERLRRWEAAMAKLHQAYPEDPDAAALYALSMLATAPPDDRTYRQQRRAAAILRAIHEAEPTHPGAIHYGIHAHDFPGLAEKGRDLADVYHRIAPEVPHALHMPSHIYVRLGEWQPNIEWNRRSAEAALRFPEDGAISLHYVHAMDYIIYGYLQLFEDQRARGVIEAIEAHERYQPNPATSYGIAAIYARYALERRQWQDAAALSVDSLPPTGLDWREHPEGVAVLVHARGLGAARNGDLEAAEAAVAELERLGRTLDEAGKRAPGFAYWAERARVQRDTVAAWVAQARGDRAQAVALMTQAAEREEALGKNPVMPGFVLPARELLGDMLLEQGEPAAALAAYERSLADAPRRANSLYGAGTAAARLGEHDTALRHYRALVDMAGDGEARPILVEARRYVDERTAEP